MEVKYFACLSLLLHPVSVLCLWQNNFLNNKTVIGSILDFFKIKAEKCPTWSCGILAFDGERVRCLRELLGDRQPAVGCSVCLSTAALCARSSPFLLLWHSGGT